MHTYRKYRKPDPQSNDRLPSITEFRFRGALDVVSYAEQMPVIGWPTWPEVWHLDDEGAFRCYFKGCSMDSVRRWADDPSDLLRSRRAGLREGGCPRRWVIVESRPRWFRKPLTVHESDAAAFVRLRERLATDADLLLVDTVIFDDQGHWWSLHELTSGTTTW